MTPDAREHDPSPEYLRALIDRSGLSQRAAARQLGICERQMRRYLAPRDVGVSTADAPYLVQFALEALAMRRSAKHITVTRNRPAPD